jgi:hypothetical protein
LPTNESLPNQQPFATEFFRKQPSCARNGTLSCVPPGTLFQC